MPSIEVYNYLKERGISISDTYNQNDSLESESDLELLFKILNSHKDINGNPPVFTANFVLANPDFDKILSSGFLVYHYKTLIQTYASLRGNGILNLLNNGIENKLFYPQLHGREHLNVQLWMEYLKNKDYLVCLGFENGFWGMLNKNSAPGKSHFMAAMDYRDKSELKTISENVKDAVELFIKHFGFKPRSFIAPCYTWDDKIEEILFLNGIRYLQGNYLQVLPIIYGNKRITRVHYLGQRNRLNQVYLVRNVQFEPSENRNSDWINIALKGISDSFFNKKPAIIASHRVNYIGSINIGNRDKNLKLLDTLLKAILKRWPGVEFMSSDQLGDLLIADRRH